MSKRYEVRLVLETDEEELAITEERIEILLDEHAPDYGLSGHVLSIEEDA